MPSLKEVRGRITSVNSTQQITKAMKMVAAAKLRRAQDNIIRLRPYVQKLNEVLANISSTIEDNSENPFAAVREVKKVLIVVVTSDRGLAGAFNTNAIKGALSLINGPYANLQSGDISILCIGKKGYDILSKRFPGRVIGDYVNTFHNLSFDTVRVAAEFAMEGFKKGDFDKVEVVYNEFKNVATQIVRKKQFLPIEKQEDVAGGVSVKYAATKTDYIFEPNKQEMVQELIPKSLKIQFYETVLESNASEHGARMTAMDKATDNAKELLKELRLTYNRTRQAAITKEILEIVGGAEALNG